jgi:ABC-type transporter Mla subunit MlaD
MAGRVPKNNLMAGTFLIGSLIAAVAVGVWVGGAKDRLLTPRSPYVLRFDIATGALGLKKDSVVKIGGQAAGMVETVDFRPPSKAVFAAVKADDSAETVPFAPRYVYVTVKVDSKLVLHRNAKVYLELPLLGSVSSLNIPDVGGPGEKTAALKPEQYEKMSEWEVIEATLAPPAFLTQAGYGEEQKTQLQNILERGSKIGDKVDELVGTIKARVPASLDKVDDSLENVRTITGDARSRWPEWAQNIAKTLVNVRDGTGSAGEGVAEVRAVVSSVQKAIDHNRPFIDAIFFNAAEVTEKVNKELYGRVTALMDDGQKAMRDVATTTTRVRQLVSEESPNLRRILADARLGADQLKLALVEIRRNPWRLLYQPKRKELAEELLYDSARTYSDAVGDLRSASDALQGLLAADRAGTGAAPVDKDRLSELTKEVEAAFERYKVAEQKFMDLVIKGVQ